MKLVMIKFDEGKKKKLSDICRYELRSDVSNVTRKYWLSLIKKYDNSRSK